MNTGNPAQADGQYAPKNEMPPPVAAPSNIPVWWDVNAPQAIPVSCRQPFNATRADGWFVPACIVLGFFWVRWAFVMRGVGMAAFCVMYAAVVLGYAYSKKIKPPLASWYWLGILLLCGLSYALWTPQVLAFPRTLLTYGAAVLWVGVLFGLQMQGKTGNWLPLDGINLLFLVPARNMGVGIESLKMLLTQSNAGGKESSRGLRRAVPILAGLALCVPLLAITVPLLAAADSGNFREIFRGIITFFREFWLWQEIRVEFSVIIFQIILGLPVGWWLFSFFAGGAHKRYGCNISLKSAQQNLASAQKAPYITVTIVLSAACALYLLFVGCQVPYFFSAFTGNRPQQYLAYAEYARAGFFELCRIAAINLGLLALAGSLVARRGTDKDGEDKIVRPAGLRFLNILLCAVTLLVIATAISKMWLYVAAYGLTSKRVLTSVFMMFLAAVCIAVIILQYKKFSIVRFAAVTGAAVLCGLCLCNLDGLVIQVNASRWQNGSLPEVDLLSVMESGAEGAGVAMEVYNQLEDVPNSEDIKAQTEWVLYSLRSQARRFEGKATDTLAGAMARQSIYIERIDNPRAFMNDGEYGRWEDMDAEQRGRWEEQEMREAGRLFEEKYY